MLESFPTGESCFIDANILGYASVEFEPLTARCRAFLGRVASGYGLRVGLDVAVSRDDAGGYVTVGTGWFRP